MEMERGDRIDIRTAGSSDAAEVAGLLHAFNSEYGEPAPPVETLSRRIAKLIGDDEILCLLAGEPAVGVAVMRIRPALWSGAFSTYLEELYVAPEMRGHGIGARLLDTALDTARRAGADRFELNTAETDTAARALYESRGMTNREGAPNGPRMLYYEVSLA